jgi:hypothetical protein
MPAGVPLPRLCRHRRPPSVDMRDSVAGQTFRTVSGKVPYRIGLHFAVKGP